MCVSYWVGKFLLVDNVFCLSSSRHQTKSDRNVYCLCARRKLNKHIYRLSSCGCYCLPYRLPEILFYMPSIFHHHESMNHDQQRANMEFNLLIELIQSYCLLYDGATWRVYKIRKDSGRLFIIFHLHVNNVAEFSSTLRCQLNISNETTKQYQYIKANSNVYLSLYLINVWIKTDSEVEVLAINALWLHVRSIATNFDEAIEHFLRQDFFVLLYVQME